MRRRKRSDDDAAMGCIIYGFLILFFMPIAGLFLIGSKDQEKQTLGWVLLIVDAILWLIVGIGAA
jgi:hypothetical protein